MAHFAVIGGGLGGLAAAIALTRVGHAVTVFEQDAEDAKLCYGGIRIPPNQSKIIAAWGLTEEFEKISVGSRILDFYHCAFSNLPVSLYIEPQ
jgi:salicylate hydroxylase